MYSFELTAHHFRDIQIVNLLARRRFSIETTII